MSRLVLPSEVSGSVVAACRAGTQYAVIAVAVSTTRRQAHIGQGCAAPSIVRMRLMSRTSRLLVSQRGDRIDPGCAPGWEKGGQKCGRCQHYGGSRQAHRIARRYSEKPALYQM